MTHPASTHVATPRLAPSLVSNMRKSVEVVERVHLICTNFKLFRWRQYTVVTPQSQHNAGGFPETPEWRTKQPAPERLAAVATVALSCRVPV